jgi:hypothetical protein
MLKTLMHQSARIIPLEPTLQHHRFQLMVSCIILIFGIGISFLIPHGLSLGFIFSGLFFISIFTPFTYKKNTKHWKQLEQKRQQAAACSFQANALTNNPLIPATIIPPFDLYIHIQRNRSTTYENWGAAAFVIIISAVISYFTWQRNIQIATQQGISLNWIIVALVFDVVMLSSLVFISVMPLIWEPQQHLIATPSGLACYRGYHFNYIPWDQAKLFAIIGYGEIEEGGTAPIYELSSRSEVIRWSEAPVPISGQIPHGTLQVTKGTQAYPSPAEYYNQMQTLLALITSRTHLPLYDLLSS